MTQENSNVTSTGIVSTLFAYTLMLSILFALLWNWDGFWQTNIAWLGDAQSRFFPAKYEEENSKLRMITKNNRILENYEKRISELAANLEKSNYELSSIKIEKEKYCSYLDTSLRMFDHATADMSDEKTKSIVKCTNKECEEIFEKREMVTSLCRQI